MVYPRCCRSHWPRCLRQNIDFHIKPNCWKIKTNCYYQLLVTSSMAPVTTSVAPVTKKSSADSSAPVRSINPRRKRHFSNLPRLLQWWWNHRRRSNHRSLWACTSACWQTNPKLPGSSFAVSLTKMTHATFHCIKNYKRVIKMSCNTCCCCYICKFLSCLEQPT